MLTPGRSDHMAISAWRNTSIYGCAATYNEVFTYAKSAIHLLTASANLL